MSRLTVCFSMYSDMSSWMRAASSPKRNSARALAVSVLPTPDGPRKMNEPDGRLGSLRPARVRRIALETATMASCWPMIRWWSSSSMRTRRAVSSSVRRWTGMPVHWARTSAISSSSMTQPVASPRSLEPALDVGALGDEAPLLVAELGRPLELLGLDGVGLLLAELGDLGVDVRELGVGSRAVDPHAAPGLVDEVDGLVGEETVREIAVGEVRRRDDRLVGETHGVVGFVAILETVEDLDGVGHRRLVDLDRLEAALESRILLEVLAVLLERRRPDRLQLAAGEHRLEDGGGVDRPLGGARTDEGVDLVDEDDDVTAGLDLLEDLLEALLEVAPVPGAGDEGAQVERVELLVREGLGDVAGDDALGKAFDDGGLADARARR